MSDAKPIWRLDPFVAHMADKYIANTQLEAGHVANCMAYFAYLIGKITEATPSPPTPHPVLPAFQPPHFQALAYVAERLAEAMELATAQPQEADDVTKLVSEFCKAVRGMSMGQLRVVPGGWVGLQTSNTVVHIIEKTAEGTFSFVTCNVASGLPYHPSKPGPPPKLLYRTCIRLDHIPAARMADPAFWTLMFAQWMKSPPSEYHRSEVLYDVLLPWLAGKLLPLALADSNSDPHARWRTSARSGTSFFGSVREAVFYILRMRGLTDPQLKLLATAFRYLAVEKARQDLRLLADPENALRDGLALGLAPAPNPEGVGTLPAPVLRQLLSGTLLTAAATPVPASTLADSFVGLFFGGDWCEPCKRFVPLLDSAYRTVRGRRQQWTVVYVSLDKSAEEFDKSLKKLHADWFAVPFVDEATRQKITELFDVKATPTLVMLGPGGRVFTVKGAKAIRNDPDCLAFPWSPIAIAAAAAARGPAPLEHHDALVLQWSCQNYASASIKLYEKGLLDGAQLHAVETHIQRLTVMAASLPGGNEVRDGLGVDAIVTALGQAEGLEAEEEEEEGGERRGEVENGDAMAVDGLPNGHDQPHHKSQASAKMQAALRPEKTFEPNPLPGGSLLLRTPDEAKYAGVLSTPAPLQPVNALELPTKVASIEAAIQALDTSQRICYLLLDRARESSTASRLVLQYEVLAIIGELFTQVLPRPKPAIQATASTTDDIWTAPLPQELQMKILEHIYQLALTYGQMWQAVEQAPRDSDCERTIVAACMLAIYDAVMRQIAIDVPMVLSLLVGESGGYRLSTSVCQSNIPFAELASRLEVRDPVMLQARSDVLAYFTWQQQVCSQVLFELRQPDKIEVKKYGSTLLFLRGLLERLGYELMPRDMRQPKPEIELLVEWMIGENTTLASEHREWAMTRDMVVIFKFLATMESKDAELMRSRKAKQAFAWWSLTFEEGGRRGWWGSLRGKPLQWEAVNFRGMDMDIADLEITGFGERKLIFGDGPATKSPAAVSKFLGMEYPTEDDVLHCDVLPTFSNTLSREEAEQLMSYLTVDYIRIPLILGFFASRDRVTYLFNPALQALVRAVCFEGGPWVAAESHRPIPQVPIRMTHEQHRQHKLKLLREGKPQPETEELGTPLGLLYNELVYSPAACADSVMAMLRATVPLHAASVHSVDASFLLYMTLLALDVEAYARLALSDAVPAAQPALRELLQNLRRFLTTEVASMLHGWLVEAEADEDVTTCCVIRAYLALLWSNCDPDAISPDDVAGFLANFLYVRNWHSFGLDHPVVGTAGNQESGLSAEDRLLRFLQAHGIDTSNLKSKDLEKYLKGKPLFLSVGGVTIRAPTLVDPNTAASKKLPPTVVPEHRLLTAHHRLRRGVCGVLHQAHRSRQLDAVLQAVMRIALRSPLFEEHGWANPSPGVFTAAKSELKLDMHTGEVFWRNDDLKPVPDSISQFTDYQAMFRGAALHCGVVAKQQRRQWVHVVGTQYDLVEWDEPDAIDQGLGCPSAVPAASEMKPAEPAARLEAAENLHQLLGFDVDRCIAALKATKDDMEEAANRLLAGGGVVEEIEDVEQPVQLLGNLVSRYRRVEPQQKAIEFALRAYYQDTIYSRPLDPYDERPHCGLAEAEHWIADILQPVLLAIYPPFPPDKKMNYALLLPEQPVAATALAVHLLGCVAPDKEDATWKEVVVLRDRHLVLCYNLVSHGRRMYRVLIYSSDHRFSLHTLAPNVDPRSAPRPPTLLRQAGSFRSQRAHEASLLIVRRNAAIGGHEILQPKRLLAGLIPAALLESHNFWRGEDQLLRGEPLEADSQWFNYNILVKIEGGAAGACARLWRVPVSVTTPIHNAREAISGANMLVRQTSASRPAQAAVKYDEGSVAELVSLGFTAAAARRALRESQHNRVRAASWLFDAANLSAISEAAREEASQLPTDAAAEARPVNPEQLASLTSMGFSPAAAQHALRVYGQVEEALTWLADPAHASEIERVELAAMDVDPEEPPEQGPASTATVPATTTTTTAAATAKSLETPRLELLDLLSAKPGSPLYRLASVLTRIEDLSHILAWGRPVPDADGLGSVMSLEVVELPRLKVRFQLQKDQEGQLRLALLDQAGWFVSDALAQEEHRSSQSRTGHLPPACRARLLQLLDGLDHGLLLTDGTSGYMVFVPNHDVHRPAVENAPFSSALVLDRNSQGWMTTMDTRYYLYPVHASFNHLNSNSLASTLYMTLVRLLARQYEAAFGWAEAAATDTELTPEESWIFEQFERTVGDRHPEAVAVRLRLSLALMYCDAPTKWELHEEMDDYLHKLPGVGAACRLTPEEELGVLTLCKQMTPLLKNRLPFLQSALGRHTGQRRRRGAGGSGDSSKRKPSEKTAQLNGHAGSAEPQLELVPRTLRWGGQPWAKVQALSLDYVVRHSAPLTRIHYKPPGASPQQVEDSELVAIVWDDALVSDEESGSNRQLGFVFLYNVLLELLPCRFEGAAMNSSFGELMTRLFQLKLARWGKETAGEGEQEYVTSKQVVLLANILSAAGATASWPPLPQDGGSQRFLSYGVNLYTSPGRESEVKQWLDMVDMVFRSVMTDPAHNLLVGAQIEAFAEIRARPVCESLTVRAVIDEGHAARLPVKLSDTSCAVRSLPAEVVGLGLGLGKAVGGGGSVADDGSGGGYEAENSGKKSKAASASVHLQLLQAFADAPLSCVDELKTMVRWEALAAEQFANPQLPFDLKSHPSAQSVVSAELLERLAEDVAGFAASFNASRTPHIAGLQRADVVHGHDGQKPALNLAALKAGLESLRRLAATLADLQHKDQQAVARSLQRAVSQANALGPALLLRTGSNADPKTAESNKILFKLRRLARQRCRISSDHMLAALTCSRAEDDLRAANPYIVDVGRTLQSVVELMLRCSRSSQVGRALIACNNVMDIVQRLLQMGESESMDVAEDGVGGDSRSSPLPTTATATASPSMLALVQRLQQEETILAEILTARRHYAELDAKSSTLRLDPRFLLSEFLFNILLRRRQVEIVTQMAAAAQQGRSMVQQMLMGQGKTTVVGPLLSLLLADGERLVVQIMPTALLAQTRDVLRARFAAVLRKRIFTFHFDRSIEDVEAVAELFDKLEGARRRGDIVCAPPEAVKSLMLKFVEELERLESFDMDSLAPNESVRNNREVARLRDQLANRSAVADGVCSLLDMLNRDGTLIQDECDLILDPLKSELNFPIGAASAMPGYRWELPIHIVDVLFLAAQRGHLTEPEPPAVAGVEAASDIIRHLHAALEEGMATACLQREPHMVLLSRDFYWQRLRPWVARWCLLWLIQAWDALSPHITVGQVLEYIMEGTAAAAPTIAAVKAHITPEATRMLNLASDWTRTVLPHCLSKINRVTYGLLTPTDLARLDTRTPQSRKLMAVPFVGKDVPSRSSEFAHPDVLIGLTVLAYRYEGIRLDDLRRMMVQLKQDMSRQVGPREQRPASALFQGWLDAVDKFGCTPLVDPGTSGTTTTTVSLTTPPPSAGGLVRQPQQLPPLPLPLFQPDDGAQLTRLHRLIRKLPHAVYYYLRQHVFPSTMRAQAVKISASGVDLGSSILFGRARLGFSGTPNNLMPADLGRCEYEPGSDGRVVHVLTSSSVTTASVKSGWSARSLLDDIAASQPPYHALLDTGALITGMDNAEVAHYLLKRLPAVMEGVVYLDRNDQQMVLLRSSGRAMPLSQCGLAPSRRFTFYDQVHTTGMDIKQAPDARAVLTIGKDMTFRDYAQGAFRMRQIGQGQTIHLFIISEVDELLKHELHVTTGRPEIDVPAWLLINSMNATSMQFCKLGLQELYNVWRKRALAALQQEVHRSRGEGVGSAADALSGSRMRRFMGKDDGTAWLKACVHRFREPIGYPLPDTVPEPQPFSDKLRSLQAANMAFAPTAPEQQAINNIVARVEQVSSQHVARVEGGLDSECVHENEAQAEEEAEEEAEQEEEKMSAFTRDDEQHNPWSSSVLTQVPSLRLGGDEPFYALSDFRVNTGQPNLQFPPHLLLTDNFFRIRWVGMGERRLKNVSLILEWAPLAGREALQAAVEPEFRRLVAGGLAPNQAAVQATKLAMERLDVAPVAVKAGSGAATGNAAALRPRYQVAVSLAEGETLRRLIHSRQPVLKSTAVALRSIEGQILDASHLWSHLPDVSSAEYKHRMEQGLLCLRFVNNEMFYSAKEIESLLAALTPVAVVDRVAFFTETLRLRRRERNRWADTPLAKVLTERSAWHLLGARAKLEQFNSALQAHKHVDLLSAFLRHDEDNDGRLNYSELQRCFETLQLGFAPRDLAEIIALADPDKTGYVSEQQLRSVFFVRDMPLPGKAAAAEPEPEEAVWQCQNCTFINALQDRTCAMCELGWTGERECPPGKWACQVCTFFNANSLFFCDVCGRSREDLSSVRF